MLNIKDTIGENKLKVTQIKIINLDKRTFTWMWSDPVEIHDGEHFGLTWKDEGTFLSPQAPGKNPLLLFY